MSNLTTADLNSLFSQMADGTPNIVSSSSGYVILPSPQVLNVTAQIIKINNATIPNPTPAQISSGLVQAEQNPNGTGYIYAPIGVLKNAMIQLLSGIPFTVVNDPNNAQVTIEEGGVVSTFTAQQTGPGLDPSIAALIAGTSSTSSQPAPAPQQIATPAVAQPPTITNTFDQLQQELLRAFGGPPPIAAAPIASQPIQQAAPPPNQLITPSVSLPSSAPTLTQTNEGFFSSIANFFSQHPLIIVLGFAALALAISSSRKQEAILV